MRQHPARYVLMSWKYASRGCFVSLWIPAFYEAPLARLVYIHDRLTAVLSRKSKYGLKALLVLAQEAAKGPVLVSELAGREAIPKKFLEAILLELKRHGVVQSKKGKGGGYFLRRQPADITFGEVIR